MSNRSHPIELLRGRLHTEFTSELPAGVHPIPDWCADPQFFPGASGLLDADTWAEVVPGSSGVLTHLPTVLPGGVMVLGNYQATLASYRRILDGTIGGFATTWRELRNLLADLSPREVFLTNAFIGLPDLARDTAPFPTTRSFTARCQQLLELEIELIQPRTVVCLGVRAASMLASISSGLDSWRSWPGYAALKAAGTERVRECTTGSVAFTAVAVQHPSAVQPSIERQRARALIAASAASVPTAS